jgi:hypothetical protein
MLALLVLIFVIVVIILTRFLPFLAIVVLIAALFRLLLVLVVFLVFIGFATSLTVATVTMSILIAVPIVFSFVGTLGLALEVLHCKVVGLISIQSVRYFTKRGRFACFGHVEVLVDKVIVDGPVPRLIVFQ